MQAALHNVILFVHGVKNVLLSNVQTNIHEVLAKKQNFFCKVPYYKIMY